MFGITLGSYTKFEELYKFGVRTTNTIKGAVEELHGAISEDKYVDEMRTAIEEAKNV